MSARPEFEEFKTSFDVDGVSLTISALRRDGPLDPIVFLHGFGSTKEDYADVVRNARFEGRAFLAYDAPGCGETACSDLSRLSIGFLTDTAQHLVDHYGFDRFHIVGHSMGGLTALQLAHRNPGRVLSFCNIEGNIAPEDCFLSRQIFDYPADDPERFLSDFIDRARHAPAYASALYASSLRHKVRAEAVGGIFGSMVDLSDNGDLMGTFLSLPCRKMFMYGDQNRSLSYLDHIEKNGVRLAEILACGHFPMYSNPLAMWTALATFVAG